MERAAAELAAAHGIPAVSCSDAHTILEMGGAATAMSGDLSTPAGFRTALHGDREMIMGRGSLAARLITPVAKVVNAARNNRRIPTGSRFGESR